MRSLSGRCRVIYVISYIFHSKLSPREGKLPKAARHGKAKSGSPMCQSTVINLNSPWRGLDNKIFGKGL